MSVFISNAKSVDAHIKFEAKSIVSYIKGKHSILYKSKHSILYKKQA